VATKKKDDQADQDVTGENISPLADSVNQEQLAASGMPTGGTDDTNDARDPGPVPDPKDNPAGPDDVSAIADPENPMVIMDPGEDPDFGGRRGGTTSK
jgi:hypothetical protein